MDARLPSVPHYVLALLSAGAAAIHFAATPAHFGESVLFGLGFALVAWFQLIVTVALAARPSRSVLVVAIAGNLAVLTAWLLSRTTGLPGLHGGETEVVAFVDAVASLLEVGVVVGAAAVLAGYHPRGSRFRPAGLVAGLSALALTSVALASPATEDQHTDHEHTDTELAADHAHTDEGDHAHEDQAHDEAAVESGGHQHEACTYPITNDQQVAADEFIAASNETVAEYGDFGVAEAEGWQPITPEGSSIVHYGKLDRMQDGRVLDSGAPESLLYAFGPNRTPYFLGAMYLMEGTGDPPQPGGCAMTWHNHENLCIAPGKGMAGVVAADGMCPQGSENVETGYMLHAWAIPMAGGPYAEIDAQAVRQAVVDAYL